MAVLPELERFIPAYRERGVPPPHILLVGPDDGRNGRNESVAGEFSTSLGVNFARTNAEEIHITGDLTAVLSRSGVAFLPNIHRLKSAFIEPLRRALESGEWVISIGSRPAGRTFKLDLSRMILVGACPARYDCPSALLKVFDVVLSVEPPTDAELLDLLEREAWKKGRVSLEPDAAQLLLRIGDGRSSQMLEQFHRICEGIEQIKNTNKPRLSRQEVENSMERLRIRVPMTCDPKLAFDLHSLSGEEFERVIKALLIEMGFEAELTKVSGDGGIDIIAHLNKPFIGGRYLFQCKRYASGNFVGASEVRDFCGAVVADRAMKGVFITTSDFTAQAKDFARQASIELVNLRALIKLFEENGLNRYT